MTVINLNQAKALKEAGFPQRQRQPAMDAWVELEGETFLLFSKHGLNEVFEIWYAAPNVEELLRWLPKKVGTNTYLDLFKTEEDTWCVAYEKEWEDKSLIDALVDCALWVLKEKKTKTP